MMRITKTDKKENKQLLNMSRKEIKNMKVKKIISGIIAGAIMLSTLTVSAFAATNDMVESSYVTINGMSYYGRGSVSINSDQKTNQVTLSTSVIAPIEINSTLADEVTVGYQLVNNATNQNIGNNVLERSYNTRYISTQKDVGRDMYPSIIVYGSHSAYKNNTTIIFDYTFAYN